MRKLIFMAVTLLLASPVQAKIYKWVDDKGVTHFGDSIPPQYADRPRSELNDDGQVVKKISGPLTPEQLKAKQDEEAKQKQAQQAAAEQKRHDQALLNGYSNAQEIDLARDRNLQQVDLAIGSIQTRMKSVQMRLDDYNKQAGRFTQAHKPVPADLQTDLKDTQTEMQNLQVMLKQKTKDKEDIRARYAKDKQRYLELTGQSAASK